MSRLRLVLLARLVSEGEIKDAKARLIETRVITIQ